MALSKSGFMAGTLKGAAACAALLITGRNALAKIETTQVNRVRMLWLGACGPGLSGHRHVAQRGESLSAPRGSFKCGERRLFKAAAFGMPYVINGRTQRTLAPGINHVKT